MTSGCGGHLTRGADEGGRAKSSPRDFYRHYLAAHAAAVALADATVILNDAANKDFWLARGG